LLVPSHLINVSIDCLFVFNRIMMDIIIINPNFGYGRLSVEWPFNCILNMRDVGFNSHPEPGRSRVLLVTALKNGKGWSCHSPIWSYGVVTSLTQHRVGRKHVHAQHEIGRGRVPCPICGWPRTCPGPKWSPTWGWARTRPCPT
jgi:hypothetical protein